MLFCPKMRIFTVHIKPELENANEKTVFIPEGFSWKALIFGVAWTLYHRLWLVSIAITALSYGFIYAGEHGYISEASAVILQIALGLYIGFSANDWRRDKLARRGFITSEVVASDSPMRAQQRYFEQVLA